MAGIWNPAPSHSPGGSRGICKSCTGPPSPTQSVSRIDSIPTWREAASNAAVAHFLAKMVKMVFELVGEGKGPQIVDWLSLTGRDRSQQAAGKAAKRKPEDDKDDEDMEGLDAPAAAGAEPTKPGGRNKDIYGDIISKWTNICQHEGTNYADVGLPPRNSREKKMAVCTGEP